MNIKKVWASKKVRKLVAVCLGAGFLTLVFNYTILHPFWRSNEGRWHTGGSQAAKIAATTNTPPPITPPIFTPPTPPINPPVQTVVTQATVGTVNSVGSAPTSTPGSVYVNITAPVTVKNNDINIGGNMNVGSNDDMGPLSIIVTAGSTNTVCIGNGRTMYWVPLSDPDAVTATSANHDRLPNTVVVTFQNSAPHPVEIALGWFKYKSGGDLNLWKNGILRAHAMQMAQPPQNTGTGPATPLPTPANAPLIPFITLPTPTN